MAESLYLLALLACPVGMGLMMWFMMRGAKQAPPADQQQQDDGDVAALRAELDQLRTQVRNGDAPVTTAPAHGPR
ncbi:hypothetical protein [Cellulomonas sp. ATA003]|uniref:hypothetical protein n=1 Tax=Cellulomonas sp. ATA003 TaxID=3073064 RepID=UPI002873C642|nr:hypothetical protein [Cellulomonas sp. ATA003]WNB84761.1 hypothetical protein REH70_13410 [Cellulomonas sp. ATA003]